MAGVSGVQSLTAALVSQGAKTPTESEGSWLEIAADPESSPLSPSASASPALPSPQTPTIKITVDNGLTKDAETKSNVPSEGDKSSDGDITEVDEDDWRLSEVPEALFQVDEDAAPEIRKVVEGFRQQCELLRAAARSSIEAAIQSNDKRDSSGITHERTLSDESAASSKVSRTTSIVGSVARSSMTSPSLVSLDSAGSKGKGKAADADGTSGGIIFEEAPSKKDRTARLKSLFKGKGKGKAPIKFSVSTGQVQPATTVECASCFDDLPSTSAIGLACTHFYCTECFVQLIKTAMQNENFWPPKCCLQDIPRKMVIKQLPDATLKEYGTKEKEYATPAKDRWYCTRPSCGLWFQGKKVGNLTRCPHCHYEMCIHCRGEKHTGRGERCPQDKGRLLLDEEAELEGWRQCYSCLQMVELTSGCRHITCTCKAEFCYTCGAKWRTCKCTEDDQRRRNERLRALRDTKRKEEEELEAALEAIAVAERREREHKILEEKRNLEAMEEARVASLRERFIQLRTDLDTLFEVQSTLLRESQSHATSSAQHRVETATADQAKLESKLETQVRVVADKYRSRREAHALANSEVTARHEFQNRELQTRLDGLQESMLVTQAAAQKHANALLIQQQKEANELWTQHQREVDRFEARLDMIRTDPEWGEQRAELRGETQVAERELAQLPRKLAKQEKWLELARGERQTLLEMEERVAISEGEATVAAAMEGLKRDIEALEAENQQGGSRNNKLVEVLEKGQTSGPSRSPIADSFTKRRPTPPPPPRAESSRAGAAREANTAETGSRQMAGAWPVGEERAETEAEALSRMAARFHFGGRGARLGGQIHRKPVLTEELGS